MFRISSGFGEQAYVGHRVQRSWRWAGYGAGGQRLPLAAFAGFQENGSMPRGLIRNPVTDIPAAASSDALAHFESLLSFETDCWDVHEAITRGDPGFVLLDVRSRELFALAHVPGAVNLPHGRINERSLSGFDPEMLFVVYCAGPHCNGADRAAVRLARLGRPVKKMIGGFEGWKDEGFQFSEEEQ